MNIVKKLSLLMIPFLLLVTVVTPVGANMLFRGGLAGSGVTEPGSLVLAGVILVSLGAWTRRMLFAPKRAF